MSKGYLSLSAASVLRAVSNGYGYGFDIMDATGLPSGTVYPALRRMEDAGLVTSRWEHSAVAQGEQRPARKYYELSKLGERALTEAMDRYRLTGSSRAPLSRPSTAKR